MKPPQPPRVAVIGVGTMGSQILRELAVRGIPATGFERYGLGHEHGAAGGETRIFRVAYKEGGQYVPLLRRAREAWRDLGERAGVRLFEPCGALTVGLAGDPDVRTVLDVAERCGVDVARVGTDRFPRHRVSPEDVMLLDRDGGLLYPSRAVKAVARLAEAAGARVRTHTPVVAVEDTVSGVSVTYEAGGERHTEAFDQVVVCTGPWIHSLVPELAPDVEIRRAVLSWFDAGPGWGPDRFPVGFRRSGGENTFSFFPDVGGGVKINLHVRKAVVDDPDRPAGEVEPEYVDRVAAAAGRCLDGLPARPSAVRSYMEGYTGDNHGVIGRHPGRPGVVVMAGFSGHGFKLAPVFAEAAADLLLHDRTDVPVDHLAISRLFTG
ncbi:MAG TPA: FAD-dependent oxidoreductase [Streptosporangiaceae bacterium]|jgi:sarcosine oxidase